LGMERAAVRAGLPAEQQRPYADGRACLVSGPLRHERAADHDRCPAVYPADDRFVSGQPAVLHPGHDCWNRKVSRMRRLSIQVTTEVVIEVTALTAGREAWQGGARPCRNR